MHRHKILPVLQLYSAGGQCTCGSGAYAQQQVAAMRGAQRPSQHHHNAKQPCMMALPLSVCRQLTASFATVLRRLFKI